MIPRTKQQIEQYNFDKKHFPDTHADLSKDMQEWLENKVHIYTAHKLGKKKDDVLCLACNNTFKFKSYKTNKCPCCGKRIRVVNGRGSKIMQTYHIARLYKADQYQVVRLWQVYAEERKNNNPYFYVNEISRVYVGLNDKLITLSTAYTMGGYFKASNTFAKQDLWNLKSSNPYRIELRETFPICYVRGVFHKGTLAKFAKQRGFGRFKGMISDDDIINPTTILRKISRGDTKLETILKVKSFKSLLHFNHYHNWQYSSSKFWKSLIIANRHGYKISDFSLYFDYLRQLKDLGLDLNNPKYICPSNLEKQHLNLIPIVEKKLALERAKRLEKEAIERATKDKIDRDNYAKRMATLLDFKIKDNELEIAPLQNLEDFAEESKALKHCVFSSKYYNREESIILSCRLNGKRYETVELDTTTFKIKQAYGACNKITELDNNIRQLITKNTPKIKRLWEQLA